MQILTAAKSELRVSVQRGPMNELGGYAFADLRVGMWATFAKTITEADIILFAAVSGDNNAIHINEEFAAGTISRAACPWIAVGKRNLRGDRQQAAR